MVGITAYGAYLPRLRLQKQVIADANAWFDSGLAGLAKGEKAMCNWDEDAVTMATEAYADCMGRAPGQTPAALYLASTSLPFADRQHSVIVAEALNLKTEDMRTMDVTSSQRAATSALLYGPGCGGCRAWRSSGGGFGAPAYQVCFEGGNALWRWRRGYRGRQGPCHR